MYEFFLTIHSLVRWLVLVSLVYSLFRSYRGWFSARTFSGKDNFFRHTTATITHIQLIIGLALYYLSPVIDFFLNNFQEAVKVRQIRFFGMEHSIMMVVAIIIISTGSAVAKRKTTDKDKFKIMAIWFTAGLLIILFSIPWPFSPFSSRPLLRNFVLPG